jgi:hypothetical protein
MVFTMNEYKYPERLRHYSVAIDIGREEPLWFGVSDWTDRPPMASVDETRTWLCEQVREQVELMYLDEAEGLTEDEFHRVRGMCDDGSLVNAVRDFVFDNDEA